MLAAARETWLYSVYEFGHRSFKLDANRLHAVLNRHVKDARLLLEGDDADPAVPLKVGELDLGGIGLFSLLPESLCEVFFGDASPQTPLILNLTVLDQQARIPLTSGPNQSM